MIGAGKQIASSKDQGGEERKKKRVAVPPPAPALEGPPPEAEMMEEGYGGRRMPSKGMSGSRHNAPVPTGSYGKSAPAERVGGSGAGKGGVHANWHTNG
ncbi:MAG: hypothetical protein HY650_02220 [Acidobacteria bacterium]|nr:hypothetical protein [Acidobacteriota bacterium]